MDDIVLSYVESIVEEVLDDPDAFDADAFVEMFCAYVPQAEGVDRGAMERWIGEEAGREREAREAKKGSCGTHFGPLKRLKAFGYFD